MQKSEILKFLKCPSLELNGDTYWRTLVIYANDKIELIKKAKLEKEISRRRKKGSTSFLE